MSADYRIHHRDGRYWVYKDGRLQTVHMTREAAEQKVESLSARAKPEASRWSRIRAFISALYDTDPGWSRRLYWAYVGWRTLVGIGIGLVAFIGLAVVAALVVWLVGGAVEIVGHHPGSTRAIGLELLVVGVIAFGLCAAVADRLPAVSTVSLCLAILTAVGGVGALASSDDPRVAHRATKAGQDFCDHHACISSFYEGRGSIVQCADGEWSHSGGIQGACSSHGGAR
jgi:hypothetical protein